MGHRRPLALLALVLASQFACGRFGFDADSRPEGQCGNSAVDPGEECDGADLGGATCTDFGFSPGSSPSCSSGCTLDTSACELGSDLRGRWTFDEGQGTAVNDASTYENHGILSSGDPQAAWTEEGIEGALHLSSIGDVVRIPNDPSLLLTGEMSIEMWVKLDSLADNSVMMNNDVYRVFFRGGGTPDNAFFTYRTVEEEQAADSLWSYQAASSSASALVPNRWHYIVAVKSATNLSVYIDGRKEKENRCLDDRSIDASQVTDLLLGGGQFRGSIDEISIWSRMLPAEEIEKRWLRERCVMEPEECSSLNSCGNSTLDPGEACDSRDLGGQACTDFPAYESGELRCTAQCTLDTSACVPTSAQAGVWEMNDGSGDTVRDTSGGGHDGTFVGLDPATSWQPGIEGTGVFYDGSGLVEVPDTPSLHLIDEMSVELWVRLDELNQVNLVPLIGNDLFMVAYRGDWARNRPYFLFRIDVEEGIRDAAWSRWSGVRAYTSLQTDTWHHIVGVKRGPLLSIYLNGVKERELDGFSVSATAPSYNATLNDVKDLFIGQSTVNGTLDRVAIYPRALSDDEIAQRFALAP